MSPELGRRGTSCQRRREACPAQVESRFPTPCPSGAASQRRGSRCHMSTGCTGHPRWRSTHRSLPAPAEYGGSNQTACRSPRRTPKPSSGSRGDQRPWMKATASTSPAIPVAEPGHPLTLASCKADNRSLGVHRRISPNSCNFTFQSRTPNETSPTKHFYLGL